MKCDLCGCSDGAEIGLKKNSHFVRCLECGLIRIDPHPTDEEIAEFYEDYVYEHRVKDPLRKRLRYLYKVLPLKIAAPGRRFLDIGCNVGNAVAAAQYLGCEATGIDLSPNAIEHAKHLWPGCRFFNETLESLALRNETFDIIYCTEVIEHVRDLHGFMRALKAVAAPGAIMFFTSRDSGHFRVNQKRILGWKELRPTQHVAIFNKSNFRRLFMQYGISPRFTVPMHRANMRVYLRNE